MGLKKSSFTGTSGMMLTNALLPYSSQENSGLQFSDDKLVSLDNARKCSLLVVILGPILFSQKFTSVISNRSVCPPQPFPHDRILFEPQPSSARRFYIDNEFSIFVYLSISNKQGSEIQFDEDKLPIKVANEDYVFVEIQATAEGRQQNAAMKVFFRKDSENKHRLHSVAMDRFVIRKLVERLEKLMFLASWKRIRWVYFWSIYVRMYTYAICQISIKNTMDQNWSTDWMKLFYHWSSRYLLTNILGCYFLTFPK